MAGRKAERAKRRAQRRRRRALAGSIGWAVVLGGGFLAAILGWGWTQRTGPPEAVRPLRPEALGPNVAEVIDTMIAAVNADPLDAERHGKLGLAYEANALWPEALSCFEIATRLAPDDPVWPYHEAIAYQGNSQFDSALARLREVTDRHPDYAPAQHQLGDLLVETGDLDSARRAMERAAELAPTSPEPLVGLARIALERQQYAEAADGLRRALAMDSSYKMAHFLLGTAYRGLGRLEEAKQELALGVDATKRYLKDRVTSQKGAFIAGLASQLRNATDLIKAGRAPEAVSLLEFALRDRPQDLNVMNNLAVAYQRSGQYQEALDILNRAIAINDSSFPTYINLAECLMDMKRYAEALPYAERAVKIAPNVGQAQFALGRALLFLRRPHDAYGPLRETLRLDTRNPEAYVALAEACILIERYGEARTALEEVTKRRPTHFPSHINLCAMCLRLGDVDAAREALRVAQRMAPDHPRVKAMEARLQNLRNP